MPLFMEGRQSITGDGRLSGRKVTIVVPHISVVWDVEINDKLINNVSCIQTTGEIPAFIGLSREKAMAIIRDYYRGSRK